MTQTYRSQKYKQTRQRGAILQALQQAKGPLSPQQILRAARRWAPGLGLATVYRNLKLLLEAGKLCRVDLPGMPTRYEVVRVHHHHFVCRGCREVFDTAVCRRKLDGWAPRGFLVDHHEVVLYGLCQECQCGTPKRLRKQKAARVVRWRPPAKNA
jgi:Fur family ferric uptake transcriptional regulator